MRTYLAILILIAAMMFAAMYLGNHVGDLISECFETIQTVLDKAR